MDNVTAGTSAFHLTTSLKPFSCAGNVSTEVILSPQ